MLTTAVLGLGLCASGLRIASTEAAHISAVDCTTANVRAVVRLILPEYAFMLIARRRQRAACSGEGVTPTMCGK
jgi:hypothetical protein